MRCAQQICSEGADTSFGVAALTGGDMGEVAWIRQFGSEHTDWTQGVDADDSGNVYLAGFTEDTGEIEAGDGTPDASGSAPATACSPW